MGLIVKADLHYKDYTWTVLKTDDPKITGEPDSTLLSRKEGYEVLYFINKLCDLWDFKLKSSAIKIEKMIRDEVPKHIHKQLEIKNWIHEKWNKK